MGGRQKYGAYAPVPASPGSADGPNPADADDPAATSSSPPPLGPTADRLSAQARLRIALVLNLDGAHGKLTDKRVEYRLR